MSEYPTPQMRHERSLQDAKTSNDLARAASQAAILINGAAATALLAYAGGTATKGGARLLTLPWALSSYAVGVLSGAIMIMFLSMAVEGWMIGWFPETAIKHQKGWHRWAEKRWSYALMSFGFSAACFVVGSALVAFGLS